MNPFKREVFRNHLKPANYFEFVEALYTYVVKVKVIKSNSLKTPKISIFYMRNKFGYSYYTINSLCPKVITPSRIFKIILSC
jgi:hypothetical protein